MQKQEVITKIKSIANDFEKLLEKAQTDHEKVNLFKTYYEILNLYENLFMEKSILITNKNVNKKVKKYDF